MSHGGGWLDAGTDALKAQVKRKQRLTLDEYKRLSSKGSAQSAAIFDSLWMPDLWAGNKCEGLATIRNRWCPSNQTALQLLGYPRFVHFRREPDWPHHLPR